MSAMSDLDADLRNLVGNPYIHTESVDKLKAEIERLRALNNEWKLITDNLCEIIERLRNAIYKYAEHVLIMEGTDFISGIADEDLKKLIESICYEEPPLGEKE